MRLDPLKAFSGGQPHKALCSPSPQQGEGTQRPLCGLRSRPVQRKKRYVHQNLPSLAIYGCVTGSLFSGRCFYQVNVIQEPSGGQGEGG